MPKKFKLNFSIIFAALWLVFTLALVGWWISMLHEVLTQMQLGTLNVEEQIPKIKKMIFWEGLTLIVLIIVGAVPLIYYTERETTRSQRFKDFFASFSHDIKTAMASLRLQVECLQDELTSESKEAQKLLTGILSDTQRLQHQLDNSLLVAQMRKPKVFLEEVPLQESITRLQYQWPQLKLSVEGQAKAMIDRRLFENLMSNLCRNSIAHGKATEATIKIKPAGANVVVNFKDNGTGSTVDISKITKPFNRLNESSGSGLGLYLVKSSTKYIGGDFKVVDAKNGFEVEMILQGGVK